MFIKVNIKCNGIRELWLDKRILVGILGLEQSTICTCLYKDGKKTNGMVSQSSAVTGHGSKKISSSFSLIHSGNTTHSNILFYLVLDIAISQEPVTPKKNMQQIVSTCSNI